MSRSGSRPKVALRAFCAQALVLLPLAAAAGVLASCDRRSPDGAAAPREGGPGTTPIPPRSILLISIDTLNRDALRCYDRRSPPLPFLDVLASQCVRFTNAVATASWTLPSQASMLTGLYPCHHGATDPRVQLSGSVATLAGQLSAKYETVAFTNSAYFEPAYGLNRGFEKYESIEAMPAPPAGSSEIPPDPVLARAREYLGSRRSEDRPLFLFVQTFSVHDYFQDPLDADDALDAKEVRKRNLNWLLGKTPCPPETWKKLEDRYQRRVAGMDRDLELLAAALERARLWDSALILFTSDHGEGFETDLARIHHAGHLYANVLRVPLLIRMPGVSPRDEHAPVSLIDVMPTLLALTRIDTPAGLDGCSLAGLLADAPVPPPSRTLFVMEHDYWWDNGRRRAMADVSATPIGVAAIRGDSWFIRRVRNGETAGSRSEEEELYDMAKDPDQRQILSLPPDQLSLRQAVEGEFARRAPTGPRLENKYLDDQLRRLGYTK